jgi:hypothetical protein
MNLMPIVLLCLFAIGYSFFHIGVWVERNRWKYGNHFINKDGVAMKILPMKGYTKYDRYSPCILEKLD